MKKAVPGFSKKNVKKSVAELKLEYEDAQYLYDARLIPKTAFLAIQAEYNAAVDAERAARRHATTTRQRRQVLRDGRKKLMREKLDAIEEAAIDPAEGLIDELARLMGGMAKKLGNGVRGNTLAFMAGLGLFAIGPVAGAAGGAVIADQENLNVQNAVMLGTVMGVLVEIGALAVLIGESKGRRDFKRATKIYRMVERLKQRGLDEEKIKEIYDMVGPRVIAEMSAADLKYIRSLERGNLDDANYETAMAIIRGYMWGNAREYGRIVQKFDESTLPPMFIQKNREDTITWEEAVALTKSTKSK